MHIELNCRLSTSEDESGSWCVLKEEGVDYHIDEVSIALIKDIRSWQCISKNTPLEVIYGTLPPPQPVKA